MVPQMVESVFKAKKKKKEKGAKKKEPMNPQTINEILVLIKGPWTGDFWWLGGGLSFFPISKISSFFTLTSSKEKIP